MRKIIAVFFILFFSPVFAETTGTINFSTGNSSVVTGLIGYTVSLCNSTSTCAPIVSGLSCFTDYDGTSSGTSSGWCNATVITNCYHDNSAYGTGTSICITNTTYRTCGSGAWSASTACSSGNTCDAGSGNPGNCTSSSSTTTTGGSGGSQTSTAVALISLTSWPNDFDIIQGESVIKYASLKNTGNVSLYNVTLSVSGVSWYNVSPAKVGRLNISNEVTFSINFTAPDDAGIKTYPLSLQASTHASAASASKTFNVDVNPSNKTLQEEIIPNYDDYSSLLASLESKASELQSKGVNVDEINALLLNAKDKLLQANLSLELHEYATAKQILDDARSLLDSAQNQINTANIVAAPLNDFSNLTFIIVVIVIAGMVVLVLYMFIPSKGEKKAWSVPHEKNNATGKMKNIFKRKKDKPKW